MGYESKIYFVKAYEFGSDYNESGFNSSQIIAVIDMCKMGHTKEVEKFKDLFNKETPFCIVTDDFKVSDDGHGVLTDTITDCYGKRLCYGDMLELIEQLEKVIKEDEENNGFIYWRFNVLLDMLKSFNHNNAEKVFAVHYGY